MHTILAGGGERRTVIRVTYVRGSRENVSKTRRAFEGCSAASSGGEIKPHNQSKRMRDARNEAVVRYIIDDFFTCITA